MGYRSTFITEDTGLKIPAWFLEKWAGKINTLGDRPPISSRHEGKCYGMWVGIEQDISRCIREDPESWPSRSIHIVWMGEDGAVSQSEIFADRVEGAFPTESRKWP